MVAIAVADRQVCPQRQTLERTTAASAGFRYQSDREQQEGSAVRSKGVLNGSDKAEKSRNKMDQEGPFRRGSAGEHRYGRIPIFFVSNDLWIVVSPYAVSLRLGGRGGSRKPALLRGRGGRLSPSGLEGNARNSGRGGELRSFGFGGRRGSDAVEEGEEFLRQGCLLTLANPTGAGDRSWAGEEATGRQRGAGCWYGENEWDELPPLCCSSTTAKVGWVPTVSSRVRLRRKVIS